MRTTAVIAVAVAVLSGPLVAQENKPVPKDSVRVFVPGCTKGYIFTAGRRTEDENVSQILIDVEGWRPIGGSCPSR